MRFKAVWCPSSGDFGAFDLLNERDTAKIAEFYRDKEGDDLRAILVLDTVRSDKDHAHYFACIQAAFDNLPEDIAVDFKTPDHLRKWALIKANYCTTAVTVAKSHAEAQRMALFATLVDEFTISTIDRRVVTTYRATSQSYETMSRKTFKASKEAVLDVLSKLLGTSVDELLRSTPYGKAVT